MNLLRKPGFAKVALIGMIIALAYLTINTIFVFSDSETNQKVSMSQIADK